MENRVIKKNSILEKNETKGNVIQFPNTVSTEEKVNGQNDCDKIIIQVPKGYTVKFQLEKINESSNLTSTLRIENQVNSNINKKVISSIDNEIATTLDCDIINIRGNNLHESNNIYKEEGVCMRENAMYEILKEQLKFLLVSISFVIFSITGIAIFCRTGLYIIHPLLYIFTLIMGVGWGITALISIKNNKV